MQLEGRVMFWLMRKDFKETGVFKLGLVMKTEKRLRMNYEGLFWHTIKY